MAKNETKLTRLQSPLEASPQSGSLNLSNNPMPLVTGGKRNFKMTAKERSMLCLEGLECVRTNLQGENRSWKVEQNL